MAPLTGTPNGPFFENSRVSPANFTDGMSNTAAVTETIRSIPDATFATNPLGVFLITGDNATINNPPLNSDADYVSLCLSQPALTATISGHPRSAVALRGAGAQHVQSPAGPQRSTPDCRGGLPHSNRFDPPWSWLSLNITARSLHPGGVNSLLADGHVQFIKNSISVVVWQAIGSLNGGEVVSSDSY